MTTSVVTWVLLAVSHVNAGTSVAMQEFYDRPACEYAASAIRQMSDDTSMMGSTHTWCVLKESK
ncbi:hypothetical protein FHX57_006770 [Paraburkholderia tropica]|uniref:hypothetical protein n=1 Tax=Paraburkholderia tropica TaxID=92647 RepID=UPI0016073993|nr:hypothetical protein [Paraburkholderia tropica]MBB3004388.1 hypothetical protein [Paraburkholderia tropica]